MAQSKTARSMKSVASARPVSAQDKIAGALKQASSQAKKQLASQGLKLPTQSWNGPAIRNPAV
jgi:hypothetical protein